STAPRHLPPFPTRRSSDLSEVTDFAVADDVVLALEPQLAPRAQIGEGPGHRHELVVPVDLRTDEAPGDIRMHDPGRILCARALRSEEHTSELQSPYDLVCR